MMIGLNKHIEILLLSNDCVIVPDFGGFMAHHVDARKDIADGSFLPPIRSIGFNPKLVLNDSLLAQSYVEAYDISYPDAVKRIEDEVRELKQRIETEGSYDFDDIGKITLNADGNYEFTPCEAGLLTPSLYGLGSFEMDTIAELKAKIRQATDEAVSLSIASTHEDNSLEANEERKHTTRIIALWRNVAVACIAIILFLLIPSPLVNNAQMAGTSIDTGLLDRVMPKNITYGQEKVSKAVSENKKEVKTASAAKETIEDSKSSSPVKANEAKYGFSIVVASHVTLKNANNYVDDLHRRGYKDAFVHRNGHVKVLMGHYSSREKAENDLNILNDKPEFNGAWVIQTEY